MILFRVKKRLGPATPTLVKISDEHLRPFRVGVPQPAPRVFGLSSSRNFASIGALSYLQNWSLVIKGICHEDIAVLHQCCA